MSKPTELISALEGIGAEDFKSNDGDRLRLVEAAKKFLSRVETKEERLFDITFGQPIVFAALKTLLDLGLWKKWATSDDAPKSVNELSELCTPKCEPNLLRRLLRLLASVYIVTEAGEDQYRMTSLWLGSSWQWLQSRTHHWDPVCINLPSFLEKTGYKEPQDVKSTNYSDWCPGNLDFFGKCVADPPYQDSFSGFMTAWGRHKVPWPQFYDTSSLVDGADLSNGGVLCVDIGGHHGIDITRLLDKHPDIPAGSLVLQDLPEVLAGAKDLHGKIRAMPHDLFQPQPVKGSRSYYMHAVLHDWPDAAATTIIKNIAGAMTKGYSKLLIVDIVLPPTGASSIQATMDVEMMAALSAYERTESMWRKLISDSGLKVIKIWQDGRKNECLVEAELA
ncbi:putative O-methyltransferase [Xylaria palmicola]|nr:putative O-methyltransferase [Xylaria palmicola]